jgi:hypothetical protein
MAGPIDAVVMWVDGNDPAHQKKRQKYLAEIESGYTDCATLEGRYIETGEIKYCIYSIRKFAPWIRHIYLVTDEQCPDWLTNDIKQELKVYVVDHKEIFRDHPDCLPTFNTMSILSVLWKIKGLSNKYISFNDDNFLIQNVIPEDFFKDDKTVLRGQWKIQKIPFIKKVKWLIKQILKKKNLKNIEWGISNPHIIGARVVGYDKMYFETTHAPHTWRIDVQRDYYEKFPDLLHENIKYRFRNRKQFGPSVIFTHLILKSGKAVELYGYDSLMIIPRKGGLKENKMKFHDLRSGNYKFLCFQDLYYLKRENYAEFKEVENYLNETILSS